jgi:hypothetical protein
VITRRDLLDIAALKARPNLYGELDYDAARKALDEEVTAPASRLHEPDTVLDPVGFAELTFNLISGRLDKLYTDACPEEYAAYRRALSDLVMAFPSLQKPWVPGQPDPWLSLQDATLNVFWEMLSAGVRIGASIEHFRRSMLNPFVSCGRCDGAGSLSEDGKQNHDYTRAQVCPDCKGRGYLPIRHLPEGVRR